MKKTKTNAEPGIKKVRVLQIYFEAPDPEDVPAGVFGGKGVEPTEWRELPRTDSALVFQHTGTPASGTTGAGSVSLEEL